jgi:hypothetical protein
MRERGLMELALGTPVCLWSAWAFFVRAVLSVKNRSLNMFTLIRLGVGVAPSNSPAGAYEQSVSYPLAEPCRHARSDLGLVEVREPRLGMTERLPERLARDERR